ncbi:hypothetical protein Tco_0841595 [Tanacetum coccineum]|uniref:MAK10-like protein n=1 Tax=Tanacetum coccineum TaxID=301880 RepID=A0ABQ5AY47_9ASTR
MGDANPIHTLGDYSKPSHEGYRITIELPDPNQNFKYFLILVDSLDLDGENRGRMCLFPRQGIDLWLQVQIFYDHVTPATRRTIDQSAGGKLRDRNAKESWELLEDLALYDNKSWNDPRDFAKPVKAIYLPQDVPSTSNRCLIELENQVQRFMEDHLALIQPTQVKKITSSCKICKGPYDTQYRMENPEQAFVEYASSCTEEAGGLVSNFMASQEARLSKFEDDFKQQQSEMTNKIDTVLKAITDRIAAALPSDTVKNPKLNVNSTTSVLSFVLTQLKTPNAQPISMVRSTPPRYIPSNKAPPMMISRKKMMKKRRTAGKISISTPPRHPIQHFHSSLKKSSNSIHFSNRSAWPPNYPAHNLFTPKGMMVT